MFKAEEKNLSKLVMMLVAIVAVVMCGSEAYAVTAPTDQGALLYDVYDIAVNQVLDGPVGFVGGLGIVVTSLWICTKNQIIPGIVGIISGAGIMNADNIVSSLGMLII